MRLLSVQRRAQPRVALPLAALLASAWVASCAGSSSSNEPDLASQAQASVTEATAIFSVFRPMFYDPQAPASYVNTGAVVTTLPKDAPVQTAHTGPPPSGPIVHVMDIVALSDAHTPRSFTLLPFQAKPACVGTTAQRAALAGRQVMAGRSEEPEVPRPTSGAEAYRIANACPPAALALGGLHPNARLVGVYTSHRIQAADIGVLDDIPEVFEPSDVERLAAAPEGAELWRISPERYAPDVALRVSMITTPAGAGVKRVWRDGELLVETTEPIMGFVLDGARAFILTRGMRLIAL